MQPPFDRDRLRQWNSRQRDDDIEAARSETPGARLALAIALSNLTLELHAAGNPGPRQPSDLADKARTYAAPLRALTRT